jgi:hypothetical protein
MYSILIFEKKSNIFEYTHYEKFEKCGSCIGQVVLETLSAIVMVVRHSILFLKRVFLLKHFTACY